MRKVIIESPYAGDVELHLRYLRACMHDSIARGEAPFASHGLYTQPGVLDDCNSVERDLGIAAGFAWREFAAATIVYTDCGISSGMKRSIAHAKRLIDEWMPGDPAGARHVIQYRALGEPWDLSSGNDLAELRRRQFATKRWGQRCSG